MCIYRYVLKMLCVDIMEDIGDQLDDDIPVIDQVLSGEKVEDDEREDSQANLLDTIRECRESDALAAEKNGWDVEVC